MEIEKKNGFIEFIKQYGMYVAVGVVIFAVALTFTLVATLHQTVPTGTGVLDFRLPMTNASIIKDFSDTELQKNDTLNQWEAHLSIDLTSDVTDVYSVLDGTITSVSQDYLTGNTIVITHANGFATIYSSLDENVVVNIGDKVSAGQKIGSIANSANSELDLGNHLHFSMKLNDKFVDPNNYLNLQEK